MKKADVKIGMKVVPFRKTVPGWAKLEESYNWKNAVAKKRPFLYVHYFDAEEKAWVLGYKKTRGSGGDFFRASDFRPYDPTI